MKLSVVVLLFVMMANSSLTAASDTLRIVSHRTIDVCSGEQRWLISASIGEVYSSDSLQSFDITIGYDSSRMTPTDGLAIGTLADQMRFGDLSPFFNFREPEEMRVGAFTLTRNVVGDFPLFAIAGTYKGKCGDEDTLTLPWVPEFNEEFKGEVKVFRSDTVRAVANALVDTSQGASVVEDTVVLKGRDSLGSAMIVVHHDQLMNRNIQVIVSIEDGNTAAIDTVEGNDEIVGIVYSMDRDSVVITVSTKERDSTQLLVGLRSTTTDTLAETVLRVKTEDNTECTCVKPERSDELTVINIVEPIVSVDIMDVHDRPVVRITHNGSELSMQFSHRQLWIVNIVDLLGNSVYRSSTDDNGYLNGLLYQMPSGAYVLHATSGTQVLMKKFLK